MSDHIKPLDTASPEFQGSVLRGILGSIAGMAVCLLVILLCWLCNFERFIFLFLLFVGMVIGWFYRLFHGRRSKPIAYAAVSVCTLLTCVLWLPVLAAVLRGEPFLLPKLTAENLTGLRPVTKKQFLLSGGLGLAGFFLKRGKLLMYVDWQRGPWYIAGFNAGGAMYNLLPEKLPAIRPPENFVVSSRFAATPRIVVEGDTLRWIRAVRKDRVFSSCDIAGVVLGPSNGSIVLYDKDFQLLAKFAGSMENSAELLRYLVERNIPIPDAPPDWLPVPPKKEAAPVERPAPQRQFVLRLKPSTRWGFAGIGLFFLVCSVVFVIALLWLLKRGQITPAETFFIIVLDLFLFVISIVFLRSGKVCRVEVEGEMMYTVSRFGRTARFSVRDVYSVSKSMGWIVLRNRQWKPLARLDSDLEHLELLENYLAFYGVNL